jgi:hypothetical protein
VPFDAAQYPEFKEARTRIDEGNKVYAEGMNRITILNPAGAIGGAVEAWHGATMIDEGIAMRDHAVHEYQVAQTHDANTWDGGASGGYEDGPTEYIPNGSMADGTLGYNGASTGVDASDYNVDPSLWVW